MALFTKKPGHTCEHLVLKCSVKMFYWMSGQSQMSLLGSWKLISCPTVVGLTSVIRTKAVNCLIISESMIIRNCGPKCGYGVIHSFIL